MDSEEIIEKLKDLEVYVLEDDIRLYHKYMNLINHGNVLDVATGWGKSAIALALCDPLAHIITVDNGRDPMEYNHYENEIDYSSDIYDKFKKYGVDNVRFILSDLRKVSFPDKEFSLFHLDMSIDGEVEFLGRFISSVKDRGYILIRNYNRFKEKADKILKGYKYLERKGEIQVIQI